jgi:hypothetical protein
MYKVIYVAIDLNRNGTPCTVTTHSSIVDAKSALHFRLQCDADGCERIEYDEVVDDDEEVKMYIPIGVYKDQCIIYVTALGNKY